MKYYLIVEIKYPKNAKTPDFVFCCLKRVNLEVSASLQAFEIPANILVVAWVCKKTSVKSRDAHMSWKPVILHRAVENQHCNS